MNEGKRKSKPSDLINWDAIKTLYHILFHCIYCGCTLHIPVLCLHSPPVLLNEIELTMIFGVEVTDVAT